MDTNILLYAVAALLLAVLVLLIVLIARTGKGRDGALLDRFREESDSRDDEMRQYLQSTVDTLGDNTANLMKMIGDMQKDAIRAGQDNIAVRFDQMQKGVSAQMAQMEGRLLTLEKTNEERLGSIASVLRENMDRLRTENSKKLDEIRGTVDEKLQTALEKRLTESFKSVSTQLEQVYTGLGEMKTLAGDVGGLKKVLSGVKTRGILGEIQLSAILEELLTKDQYDTNVAVIPESTERVEFAVKLPGSSEKPVYMPIDSKFPGERYQQLLDARESGDKNQEKAALKNLEAVLCSEAKDIRDKYVEPPYTTNFGIMFLPFEGLYCEAVNLGLLEKLQREYRVTIAGPSTMAALLNSLQMGFRTLAIQKRSDEVWNLLGAVKAEFAKYHAVLEKMQKHLSQTSSDLDDLIGARTNAINRKLRSVEMLQDDTAASMLEMPGSAQSGEEQI